MSYNRENNKPKINKFITPAIAAGVFLVFVVVSLLLAKQDMRRFLIILLLLTIIGLCGYFIYSIRKAEKAQPSDDNYADEERLRSRLPLRTELFKHQEETVAKEEPSEIYNHRAEVGVNDNLFGLEDEPMVFDTNRARRTADASIIRKEDPTERDFEDYHMDMAEQDEIIEEPVAQPVPAAYAEEPAQAETSYRYERKPIERPAFRGFTRTLEHNPAVNTEVEEPRQYRTTFEPARETEPLFQDSYNPVDEVVEEETGSIRETTFSANKPFKIPSIDDEPETVVNEPQPEVQQRRESVNRPERDNFRIPEVGGSDSTYRSAYNREELFRGTGGAAPAKTAKPAETGLFGGAGYKSPFDK